MSFPDLVPALASLLPDLRGRLSANVPMADLTWFRVGGPAQAMVTPADADDLAYLLARLPADIPVTVVGVGSNLIVRDGGIPGLVIRLSPRGFGAIAVEDGGRIAAGAAVLDRRLAEAAAEAGLGGLEFLVGIPGSVGGALRMNAGAHGREIKDVLVEARAVTRAGASVRIAAADMGFAYRTCAVGEDRIFTGAVFQGAPADVAAIRARMAEVTAHREQAQPIREKTGGSTFKNPPGRSAWKLIDEAGCRGLTIGGAQVSPMHTNFLVNTGAATAADIETLGETVRKRVFEATGIELQWEIRRIGVPERDSADGR
jgi:UDP-N-acetylmuramate dehydrogenase